MPKLEKYFQGIVDEYTQNDLAIESIFDSIFPALEDGDDDPTRTPMSDRTPRSDKEYINASSATNTNRDKNNDPTRTSTTNNDDKDNQNNKNNSDESKDKNNFLKKIDEFVKLLKNILSNHLTEFRKNIGYFLNQNKQYQNELQSLKGKKFKQGLILKNWKYDDSFYNKYKTSVINAYRQYQDVISMTYNAFRHGDATDDWRQEFKKLNDNPYHSNIIMKISDDLGIDSDNINDLIAKSRTKYRGNINEPEEHEITDADIQSYFRILETYNAKAQELNRLLDNVQRSVNTMNGMCNYLKSNINETNVELRKVYLKEITLISKNLNAFLTLTKFQITMNNERAVNANFVIRKAYGL